MIGRTAKLQVLAFVLVSLLGVGYVGVRYVGLGDRLLDDNYVVHLDLARAGGIFPNAPVTYRGVPVGRVTDVTLHGTGVRADLRLRRDVRVPDDLWAVVTQRSAVGEQYVDLRPERDTGPYLADGAVIPADRTGVPLAPEALLTNLDALVRSVDPDDLNVLITELGAAFEGNEQALSRILDAGDALLADATDRLPETLALIHDARTVLTTQAESSEALRRWAAGLAALAATVRASDPDLRRLLANGPPAGAELVALLRGLEPTVGTLLGNLVTVNGIAARRLPGIEQLLVVYPASVAGSFTVMPGDGTAHLGLVVNLNDPPGCVYRGGSTQCSPADEAAGAGVRGTGNAPRAGGPPPAQTPPAAPPAAPGGYDPATGLVLGSDGRPLQFGGTGGQARLAGDQSWKQLLLAGVTP
ncbi:phospholipid/cholesterol/gamma-HCH transport system substrate-binding protein [Micromonospora pallida]|uniref:Phospholipid/cholesterol/gamma-HCH transport system substrate-binding protein n=1 Tax=Micromonospora pallida TaxID=145854 RepID=A0A1C6SDS3_9ACTN|nr:MlaD family protein [Micromonospora pallida]SCL27632.1 phospholipid/cholesterol/gamma-HCH transport system substrate-binding protein [Micromonospora pallida]